MKFKTLYIALVALILASATADFLLTWWSFRNYLMLHELNPIVNLLRRCGLTRTWALAITFAVTVVPVLAGYKWVKRYFESPPYNGDLSEVGRHLADLENPKSRDLEIFAMAAIYFVFLYTHIVGIERWVNMFVL